MKIGINGRFISKPNTGIGQYTINLLKELSKIDKKNQYLIFIPNDFGKLKLGENFKKIIIPETKIGTAGTKKTHWEQKLLPKKMRDLGVETAWFPYPANPWSKWDIKTIITVHDCIPWSWKEYRKGALSSLYHKKTRKAVAMANLILTVSQTSAKKIATVCKIDAAKIKVILPAAAKDYKQLDNADLLANLGVEKHQYYLYVGGYDLRKNVQYLLKEHKNLKHPLVLAGGQLFNDQLYSSYVADAKNTIKTGFLDAKELAALYSNCAAYVSFSKEEGFNIPIAEASACGAPIILSDIEVHREVAGDSAWFVDISKVGSGKVAMEGILKDRKKWAARSAKIAENLSWEKSAKELKDVLTS